MTHLLTYGLFEGQLTHISTVKNGLSCGCICANCKAQLVAKNNADNVKALHFSHFAGAECQGAYETALHLLAKEVILELKTLLTPDFHSDYNPNNWESLFKKGQKIKFDEILVEQVVKVRESIVVPDVIGRIGGKELFIEFANTHFTSEEKIQKLREQGVAAIEISLKNQTLDKKALAEFLLNESSDKYWLTNLKLERAHLQKIRSDREQLRLELKSNEEKLKKYQLTLSVRVLALNNNGVIINCPKKVPALNILKTNKFYNHVVLGEIIDGKYWNNKIYLHKPSGASIYFKGKRVVVFFPNIEQRKLTVPEKRNCDLFYAGLKVIQEICENTEFGNCGECKYSVDHFNIGDKGYQICSHPKT